MHVDPILRDLTIRDPDLIQAPSRATCGTPSGLVGKSKPEFDGPYYRKEEGTARWSAALAF